jgi:transposase
MWIIGCDFHPGFQQVAYVNDGTGDSDCLRLGHGDGAAEQFYRKLEGEQVVIGMEATGTFRWFERLVVGLGFQLRVGDPARIHAAGAHKPKTDKRDARLLRQLLVENRFPQIWQPNLEQRNERQLVLHRHRLVQMRTRVKNQLQSLAMNEGVQRKSGLWCEAGRKQLLELSLSSWGQQRRQDLLELLDTLGQRITVLDKAVAALAQQLPESRRLMTHPGIGPVTSLAYVLTVGDAHRFHHSRQVAAYFGLVPLERSSGGRQRLGHITKQGSSLMRALLVEAAHVVIRKDEGLRRVYVRLAMKKNRSIAAVAVARRLAVRLWWMWKLGLDYGQMCKSRSHAE